MMKPAGGHKGLLTLTRVVLASLQQLRQKNFIPL